MILALDLGTKTGFAYQGENGLIVSGVWDYTAKKGEWVDKRYAHFYDQLGFILTWFPSINEVWYEEPTPQSTNARKVLYGLLAILKSVCYNWDITPHTDDNNRGVHPTTLKKWCTGNGRADKQAMIDYANGIMNEQGQEFITDDNQADAVCLLAYAEAHSVKT